MELGRKITKKRGLFGYDPNEVQVKFQALNDQHQKERDEIQAELELEVSKHEELKAQLAEVEQTYSDLPIHEQLMFSIKNFLYQQNEILLAFMDELQEEENSYENELEQKIRYKELAHERIENVLMYLEEQKNELKKELVN